MRHEGKITGLAAMGKVNEKILDLFDKWFKHDFLEIENVLTAFHLFKIKPSHIFGK